MPAAGRIVLGAALVLGLAAAPARAGVPLPHLPDPTAVAKYKLTVSGAQNVLVDYRFEPPASDCSSVTLGEVSEHWQYARGKAVVLVFERFGGKRGPVLVRRQGRRRGDLAFATQGKLTRAASGSYEEFGPHPPCRSRMELNVDPSCSQPFKVTRNLRVAYVSGKFTVEGASDLPRNPSKCGNDTDVLTPEFPIFSPATGRLSAAAIFARKKGFKVTIKSKPQVGPLPVQPYTTITRYFFQNELEFTLTRIKS